MIDLPDTEPVPAAYRGVWRRSLLAAPGLHDTTTTVFWMQTSRWHADIRLPAGRPDFSGVRSLADCSEAQLAWLATQQGFAGVTTVDRSSGETHWRRVVDFQPPTGIPDAGHARFENDMLVETGIFADYLEHWHLEPDTDDGFAVFHRIDDGVPTFLLTAGMRVMLVRARPASLDVRQWSEGEQLRQQLDFEISCGERNADGWRIRHSTFPWREGQQVNLILSELDDGSVQLDIDGSASRWEVLEWTPPAPRRA